MSVTAQFANYLNISVFQLYHVLIVHTIAKLVLLIFLVKFNVVNVLQISLGMPPHQNVSSTQLLVHQIQLLQEHNALLVHLTVLAALTQ